MGNIERIWQPSTQSLSGQLLEAITHTDLSGDSLCQRFAHVAFRCFAALALLFTMAIDLISWSMLTLTIVVPCRIGLKDHLLNLTAALALPIIALTIPFGAHPSIDETRPFYAEIPPPPPPPLPPPVQSQTSTHHEELLREGLATELWRAAEMLNADRMEHLIKEKNVDPNALSPICKTPPLFQAVAYNKIPDYVNVTKAVNLLLKYDANPHLQAEDGTTAFIIAASHLHKTVVDILLKRNVDTNLREKELDGNALYHVLWGTSWLGIVSKHNPGLEFCNADLNVWNRAAEDRPGGVPIDPKRLAVAKQLIQAETELYDHHLTELSELHHALDQNQFYEVAEIIKRYPNNPFIRMADKLGRITLIHMLNFGELEMQDRKSSLLKNMQRILDNAKTMKQQKMQIAADRAKAITAALATCSENGMPKELAMIISEYCYC